MKHTNGFFLLKTPVLKIVFWVVVFGIAGYEFSLRAAQIAIFLPQTKWTIADQESSRPSHIIDSFNTAFQEELFHSLYDFKDNGAYAFDVQDINISNGRIEKLYKQHRLNGSSLVNGVFYEALETAFLILPQLTINNTTQALDSTKRIDVAHLKIQLYHAKTGRKIWMQRFVFHPTHSENTRDSSLSNPHQITDFFRKKWEKKLPHLRKIIARFLSHQHAQ